MFPLLAIISTQVAKSDCSTFVSEATRPIKVQIGQLSATQITPDAIPLPKEHAWEPANYRVGKFVYQNNGYIYYSDDPRFGLVKIGIENKANAVCQYRVGLPSGYDSGQGKYVKEGQVTLSRRSDDVNEHEVPNAVVKIGAKPELSGYIASAAQPMYFSQKQILIVLMKPKGTGPFNKTLIVASSMKTAANSSIVLAKLIGDYGSMSILPNIHGTDWVVNLVGQGADGSLRTLGLRIDGETVNQLVAQLGIPMQ